ncbi:MAG TPA: hypothetical protein VF457_10915 [Burkholderiaceae bacterium]
MAVAALAGLGGLSAAAAGEPHPLKLHYGLNKVDITGQGDPAVAVLAHRENFNAHSFEVLALYLTPRDSRDKTWNIVPLFDDKHPTGALELYTDGGADCLLHDYRLLAAAGQPMRIVLAARDFGQDFADTVPVRFDFYVLKTNEDQDFGRPYRYFEHEKSVQARHPYCDVGEAFRKELGY